MRWNHNMKRNDKTKSDIFKRTHIFHRYIQKAKTVYMPSENKDQIMYCLGSEASNAPKYWYQLPCNDTN